MTRALTIRILTSLFAFSVIISSARSQSIPGLRHQWVDPPVLSAEDEEYTIHFSASATNIDSIVLYRSSFDFMINGEISDSVVMYDDGIAPDNEANDLVFTSPAMQVKNLSVGYKPGSTIIKFEKLVIHQGQAPTTHTTNTSLYIRYHLPIAVPEVINLSDHVQYTSHVFNVSSGLSAKEMANVYYQYFEDDKEFIVACSTVDQAGSISRSSLLALRETIIGIDIANEIKDYSEGWGSDATLEARMYLDGGSDANVSTFNHELAHRWCGLLPDTFRLNNAGSHWNGSFALPGDAFNGVGVQEFRSNGDSTYTALPGNVEPGTYSALDLYLAGYIGIDDIPWPILTIQDVEGIQFVDGNIVYTSASPLRAITKDWFLEEMPLRSPSVEISRKEQGMAFFVNSSKPLTPSEISYWHTVALELERTDGESIYSPQTHYELTGGLGSINTRLTRKQSVSNHTTTVPQVAVYPIPAFDQIHITSGTRNIIDYKLLDMRMQTARERTKLSASQSFDVSDLPNGYYVLVLTFEDGNTSHQLISVIK